MDNDCDGTADEGFEALVTLSPVLPYQRPGILTCAADRLSLVCGAVSGDPPGDDANCDGVDDDCDGQIDESYVALDTACGVGGCAAVGVTACVAGQIQDSCTPGAPAADDVTCDGIDDNCNGDTDEGYVSLATNCGTGACADTGQTFCVNGAVEDSCTPGDPAADDVTCDGIDDNCNGDTDEGYVALVTNCGVGACAESGVTSCVAGAVEDSCTPGAPAADDVTCDGIDDNCNGDTDEGYVSLATNCGVGACAETGQTACVNGAVEDSCTPGVPEPGTECTDDTCVSTQVPHSNFAAEDSVQGETGDTVVVTCDVGYSGGGNWICEVDGTFTGSDCDPNVCLPTEVPNSNFSASGSIVGMTGDTVTVTCDVGYSGGGDWTCGVDGTFTGSDCIPNVCASAEVPNSNFAANGSIVGVTGDTVMVACDEGYSGGGNWICQ